jgi:WS/DGAT/MGAT family acyltransferase
MSRYERLSVQDRLHLDIEDENIHTHVAGVFIFDAGPLTREEGGIDIDRICDFIDSRLFRIPRYRQRVVRVPIEGHPFWIDDPSFNLLYHVRHTRLPLPGDARQLKRLVGRIASQKLDRGKPLWELWIVEGYDEDRFAAVIKVHHCMADGIAATELIQTLLSLEPEESFEPPPTWLPAPVPEGRELLESSLRSRLGSPFTLARGLIKAAREPEASMERVREGIESLRQAREVQATTASGTPFNLPIGPYRRFDWHQCELEDVKKIRKAIGGKVNDVILATVAGAVSRFLEQRGIPSLEQRHMDFRVAVPVNIRPSGDHSVSGNFVSSLIVPIPLAEPDPRRRLERVTEATLEAKSSGADLAVQITQTASDWTWPGLYGVFAQQMVDRRTSNMIVSDVPGPRADLYLLEARLREAYPLGPLLAEQALGIACFSYGDKLFWGFNSEWELMPDLHDFVSAIEHSFRELCDAADKEPEDKSEG